MDRCSVSFRNKQCRATKDIMRVQIATPQSPTAYLELPGIVVINLCPKHFVMKKVEDKA